MRKELRYILAAACLILLTLLGCSLGQNKNTDMPQLDDTQPAPDEIEEVEEIK